MILHHVSFCLLYSIPKAPPPSSHILMKPSCYHLHETPGKKHGQKRPRSWIPLPWPKQENWELIRPKDCWSTCVFLRRFFWVIRKVCVCVWLLDIYIYTYMYKYICIYIYMYMLTCIYIYKCLVVLEVTPCQYISVYIWRVGKSCCCYRNHPLKITDMFEYMSSLVNHPCFPINTLFFLHNHHKRAWRPIVLF